MRGSFTGLSLDTSLTDLALKYNVTLESIALQTRHILDTLNSHGHSIHEIYMSGGQAKNASLVQLLADVCNVGVVLPGDGGGTAVVAGAAMLGRFAHEITRDLRVDHQQSGAGDQDLTQAVHDIHQAPVLRTQQDVDRASERFGERLWTIMVCQIFAIRLPRCIRCNTPAHPALVQIISPLPSVRLMPAPFNSDSPFMKSSHLSSHAFISELTFILRLK